MRFPGTIALELGLLYTCYIYNQCSFVHDMLSFWYLIRISSSVCYLSDIYNKALKRSYLFADTALGYLAGNGEEQCLNLGRRVTRVWISEIMFQ